MTTTQPQFTKPERDELIEKLGISDPQLGYENKKGNRISAHLSRDVDLTGYKPIKHPIMIGDVLAKMEISKETITQYADEEEVIDLMRLWKKCVSEEEKKKGISGFTKSFQELTEKKEWERHEQKYLGELRGKMIDRLPEPANSLAVFLRDLFKKEL